MRTGEAVFTAFAAKGVFTDENAGCGDKDNGWGISHNGEFLDFPKQDETGIAVTMWVHKVSVKPHRHHFHEFALITKGVLSPRVQRSQSIACARRYLFIEPGEQHGYEVSSNLELINCQFYPEMLGEECNMTLDKAKEQHRASVSE